MKLDVSKVEFSQNDRKLGIAIPTKMSEELAYFIGFHAGDGHMNISRRKNKVDYLMEYSGHKINEAQFYEEYLKKLIFQLFNKRVKVYQRRSTVSILFRSKAINTFLHHVCGLPLGKKTNMKVPKVIRNGSKKYKAAYLRGIADTDFSLVFKKKGKYPVINHRTNSLTLHKDIKLLLEELEFEYFSSKYMSKRREKIFPSYVIELNGKKRLKQWLNCIGFASHNTLTRLAVWQEYGYLPADSNITQRIKLLEKRGIKFPKSAPDQTFEKHKLLSNW